MNTIKVSVVLAILTIPLLSLAQATIPPQSLVPVFSLLLLDSRFAAHSTGRLNDTGLDWSGAYPQGNNSGSGCIPDITVPLHQDCFYGRDVRHDNNIDGHAGFSFVKIDEQGNELPTSADQWNCVGDNVTGLMWEVKKSSNTIKKEFLHDADDSYTWYSTNSSVNGGSSGTNGAGKNVCFGYNPGYISAFCNTQAFVARVNEQSWCGHNDWRVPTRSELLSIVDYSSGSGTIDDTYFPEGTSASYWTNSRIPTHTGYPEGVWAVSFFVGGVHKYNASDSSNGVRLVRSE